MPATNVNWPTPLTRLNPWYPGQMGVPGTWTETGLRLNTEGTIFYVDPNHPDPNDNRDGTDPTSPLATIAAAVGKCEAYRGDTIAVMHNGYWTYGDMAANHITPIRETVTLDVPGVRLVGVAPSGCLGVPWVATANNDVLITVEALDVTIEGFNFWEDAGYTGVTAIAAAWNGPPYGENMTVRHCYFYNMDYGISLDYSWNCYIEDCRFQDIGAVAIYAPGVYGDPDYLTIKGCVFVDNVADIDLADADAVLIEGNRIIDGASGVVLDGGSYNQILNNTISVPGGTIGVNIAGGNYNQIVGNIIGGNPTACIVGTAGTHNMILNNGIEANPAGANNMINLTGGANNLVCGNCLSCSIAQYDTTCSDAGSGVWGGNHCGDGDTVAPPI